MKRIVTILLSLAMVFSFASCGDKVKVDAGLLAFCSAVESVNDQSFNQSCWAGVEAIAEKYNLNCNYWAPEMDTTEARMDNIDDAVAKGATAIVVTGTMYAEALCLAAEKYPEVSFIGIDINKSNILDYADSVPSNVTGIVFKEEQAGYLAGYAVAKEGFDKLGFLGGIDVPAVVRYGSGFLQGVNDAATAMDKTIEVKYNYSGQFFGDSHITSEMKEWYADGTQVVFACGGGIYTSVLEAALESNQYIIGVDSNQYDLGKGNDYNPFLTSAMKNLQVAVENALATYLEGNFSSIGGTTASYGLEEGDYVGLPTEGDSWNMKVFTVDEYETVKSAIKDGSIVVSDDTEALPKVGNVELKIIK